MAKIARALQKLFGSTGATTEFGVFGSDSEGSAATTKDPALIQSLATYLRGLYGSTANATQPPRIQDLNALYYLFSRQIAYGFQAGVPEWIATENYYANASVVLGSNGKIYISKTGTDGSPNINNNPTTDTGTNWRFVWTNDVFSAFPLSDLSRVMRVNGDGVPTFPDNVAGRKYWNDDFTTTDSWGGINGTVSVSGGTLIGTATSNPSGLYRDVSGSAGDIIRVKIKASISVLLQFQLRISGVDTLVKTQTVAANTYTYIDIPATSAFTRFIVSHGTNGITTSIDTIYIGSGLYDTPVYDKACCNRATNKGVLPVPGPRGLALSFNGAQSLVGDNPIIGTTGTIAFKFKRKILGTLQAIMSNQTYGASGALVFFEAGNTIRFAVNNGSTYGYSATGTQTDTANFHSCVITFESSALRFYIDGIANAVHLNPQQMALATAVLYIGRESGGSYGSYDLADIRYDSRIWTQDDVTRYHNGDDAVDSQQKAVTPVPHSIVTRGANGEINASNMFAYDIVIDSDAKLAQWAASGTWEKVLIKKGTWMLDNEGVDLTARGTKLVIGEPGSKLVFSFVMKGLYYTSLPTTKDYRMNGVTVECTGTGARGFFSCTNLTNCTGTGSSGFFDCKKMQQNTATGSTNKYISSYADAGTAYPCADTPNGGFNS